jgi:hypothetical protein
LGFLLILRLKKKERDRIKAPKRKKSIDFKTKIMYNWNINLFYSGGRYGKQDY